MVNVLFPPLLSPAKGYLSTERTHSNSQARAECNAEEDKVLQRNLGLCLLWGKTVWGDKAPLRLSRIIVLKYRLFTCDLELRIEHTLSLTLVFLRNCSKE